jgi:hypothetical protein
MDDEIRSKIETIELALINDSILGFDPAILSILDNVEIGQDEVENLKSKLGPDVFIYLFNIANSAYHGTLRMGPVKHFFDVVNRIGMQHTKALIILFKAFSWAACQSCFSNLVSSSRCSVSDLFPYLSCRPCLPLCFSFICR